MVVLMKEMNEWIDDVTVVMSSRTWSFITDRPKERPKDWRKDKAEAEVKAEAEA